MNMFLSQTILEVQEMISINKIDAFSLVIEAIEKNDVTTANEMMKIISKSIQQEKKNNNFSQQIDIVDKKDVKYYKELSKNQLNKV